MLLEVHIAVVQLRGAGLRADQRPGDLVSASVADSMYWMHVAVASAGDPPEVFTAPMRLRVPAIICVHNHPSGDPMPSMDDQEITRRLKECADMMMIRFLDHIILGYERFFSFSDRGLL